MASAPKLTLADVQLAARHVIDAEVRPSLDSYSETLRQHGHSISDFQRTQSSFQETQAALSKALERLSLVVVGDNSIPNYHSLAQRVEILDKARIDAELAQIKSHAKLAGMWGVVTVVVIPLATLLAKLAWHVDLTSVLGSTTPH